MRHLNKKRKLNLTSSHRKAMFSNMAVSLLKHGTIETTDAKAKELRGVVERIITIAKANTLQARRQVFQSIKDKDILKKLFDEVAPRYISRHGGYTRVLKNGFRKGDNAPLSVIQLVESNSN